MRKKTITTTIGTINLNDVDFCENSLDVFIGIESVSQEIREKITKAVEIRKTEYLEETKECCKELKHLYWTDSGVKTDLSLHIIVDNKEFSYRIEVDIIDKENEFMWTSASIEVDLSEYQSELKKVIVKAMIDKFF